MKYGIPAVKMSSMCGMPYYVSGPNDSPMKVRMIMRTLERMCGKEGYDYMIGVKGF